jgi:deazaflavin-dependent oxidoreductase (nitroreductase family)
MSEMSERNDWNRRVIEEFRANGGQVAQFGAMLLVLLTTTGAKSGRSHTTPLACLEDGDRLVVFGSKAGAPSHPDWYHNLVANPQVTVEFGSEKFAATAVVTAGPERDALYARQAERAPVFAEYQAKTERQIPVVALVKAS